MARSCTILGAKPGSLNLTLRATGSQGSFQAEEGGGRQNGIFKKLILVAEWRQKTWQSRREK